MSTDENLFVTSSTLLKKIKDSSDHQSWQRFFDRYSGMIYRNGIAKGLSHAEAEELVQEIMSQLVHKITNFNYDREKGSFRGWLNKITQWRIIDQMRRRILPQNAISVDIESSIVNLTAPVDNPAVNIDREWMETVIRDAAESVKGKISNSHYQIFDQYFLQELDADEVSKNLGVKKSQVYLVKLRVGRLFVTEITKIMSSAGEAFRKMD